MDEWASLLSEPSERLAEKLMQIPDGSPEQVTMANVGRQMRVSLSAILSTLQALAAQLEGSGSGASPSQRYLSMIQQNCFRLMRLSNNLIDVPLLESGQIAPSMRELDMVSFGAGVINRAAEVARCKNVSLVFSCPEEAPLPLQGDEVLLERMLYNLLSNAVKFSASGEVVTLAVLRQGEECSLRVGGRTHGVTETDVDRLCRLYEESVRFGATLGLGLGLRIAALIAERHGGRLRIFLPEKKDGGTGEGPATVYVTLPLRQASDITTLGTLEYDYAGDFPHELLELSDAIPSGRSLYRP